MALHHYPADLDNTALYLRKSRADLEAEARGEGETLAKHRRALLELARKYRYVITDVFEEVVSGERILDRPEVQKMLNNVRSGRYKAVLCMDIDRLGRGNMIDQGLIQEAFKSSNTLIITPRKVYDLQDELDEEWSEFEAFMARRELKIITRRLQRGRRASAADGRSLSRKPPYGYLRNDNNKLYPHSTEAPIVRLIFELHAAGNGIVKIARHLTDIGAEPPQNHRGRNHWTHATINDILRNEAYLGRIIWGQHKRVKENSHVRKIPVPREEWIVVDNAHEPLISEDLWNKSQRAREMSQPRTKIDYSLKNPLAGIVRCARCGRVMAFRRGRRGRKDRLQCPDYQCQTRSAVYSEVEDRLMSQLQALAKRLPRHKSKDADQRDAKVLLGLLERKISALETEIEETHKQRDNLHALLERGIYDVDTFLERSRKIGELLSQLEANLTTVKSEYERARDEHTERDQILPAIAEAVKEFSREKDIAEKNRIMKSVLESVTYRNEPDWSKESPFELEVFIRV